MKRCFAFGCSFTGWYFWPTWADFVGVNHDEYYNFGNAGLSNGVIHHRILETDTIYGFTENDTILIGVTAFGRYNWLEEKNGNPSWFAHGGPENWPDTERSNFIRKNLWQHKWGIYDTWLMVNTAKRIQKHTGCKVHIIMALDNSHFLNKDTFDLSDKELEMAREIYSYVTIQESLQTFGDVYPKHHGDNHPGVEAHFNFVKKYFPESITEKSSRLFEETLKTFTDSRDQQAKIYHEMIATMRKDEKHRLYGSYH